MVQIPEDMEGGIVLEDDQYISQQQGPDETQGAAEAMVQLSAQYPYYQVCNQCRIIHIFL